MNKTVLVTGSGHGIGKSIAIELAKSGYDIGINYCGSEIKAMDTKEQIMAFGKKCIAIKADLSDFRQISTLFDTFISEFGKIDVLINNAGITKFKPFLEVDKEMFDYITSIDWQGLFFCSQHAAKNMIINNIRGNIINISSAHRLTNFPIASVYGPVKTAVYKFTQHLALELAPYGIRANSISPGYIKVTDSNVITERERMMVSRIPIGRIGQPYEIASAVKYLISDEAQYITGSDLVIDGGSLLPAVQDNTYFNQASLRNRLMQRKVEALTSFPARSSCKNVIKTNHLRFMAITTTIVFKAYQIYAFYRFKAYSWAVPPSFHS